jgi:hypothetical protein
MPTQHIQHLKWERPATAAEVLIVVARRHKADWQEKATTSAMDANAIVSVKLWLLCVSSSLLRAPSTPQVVGDLGIAGRHEADVGTRVGSPY